jgi:hypothetical protein
MGCCGDEYVVECGYIRSWRFALFLVTVLFWGCRVSTGEQIVELQAEVSVRTLVKQPTKQ